MKFSYSTTNWIFFRFLIILPNLLIFDRQNIDKIRTQKSLLGIRLWGITFLHIERAWCLSQINAIKLLGNPTGKIFQRQNALWGKEWPKSLKSLCNGTILIIFDLFASVSPVFYLNEPVNSQNPFAVQWINSRERHRSTRFNTIHCSFKKNNLAHVSLHKDIWLNILLICQKLKRYWK